MFLPFQTFKKLAEAYIVHADEALKVITPLKIQSKRVSRILQLFSKIIKHLQKSNIKLVFQMSKEKPLFLFETT